MGRLTRVTCVVRPPRLERTGQSAVARSSQGLGTPVNAPLGSTIWKHFCWRLKPHQPNSASPQRGRSEASGARRAERTSEAGARGRTNKVSGRLITAILFGSAARRCSWENRIFCYQMTVLLRRFLPKPLMFEDSRRCFSCGVRELKATLTKSGGCN